MRKIAIALVIAAVVGLTPAPASADVIATSPGTYTMSGFYGPVQSGKWSFNVTPTGSVSKVTVWFYRCHDASVDPSTCDPYFGQTVSIVKSSFRTDVSTKKALPAMPDSTGYHFYRLKVYAEGTGSTTVAVTPPPA